MTRSLPRRSLLAGTTAVALAVVGCSNQDPLATGTPQPTAATAPADGTKVVVKVGSARFAESEIIAELYAQALEAEGVTVERNLQIGAREVYLGALDDGSVDLVPEYTGNLLAFWDPAAKARTPDEVNAALTEKAPDGVRVLTPSPAEDKDSYCVTADFAAKQQVASLADLAKVSGKLRLAGNPELAERPYGPKGLASVYGVPTDSIEFTPIDDGGGPLTVKALVDGDVDIADIYTTTPAIKEHNLVVLADPENLILPQHVVALVSYRVSAAVDAKLNEVSAQLTTDDLIAMNARSSGSEKASATTIAKDWLKEKGLID